MISLDQVKKLRELTFAPIGDCREALEKSGGDFNKAVDELRKIGKVKSIKKSERATGSGIIESYVHPNRKIGVLVDLRCETDFVAKNETFLELAHELVLQVAAMNPLYISREDVPAEVLSKEKELYKEDKNLKGKPANVVEQIVNGKLENYFSEVCLLEQQYVKDPKIKISDLVAIYVGKIGENIKIKRFTRLEL